MLPCSKSLCCTPSSVSGFKFHQFHQSVTILSKRHRTYTTPRSSEFSIQTAVSPAINPPATTHPPPLQLPEKLPALPVYKYYFRLGKAYAAFYKTGLKAVWTNYRLASALPKGLYWCDRVTIHKAVRQGLLSRADFQLIRRAKSDFNKLPPFALLWIVCGEFTPLVVTFFPGAVPKTVWIPRQVQRAREKAEKRRATVKEKGLASFAGLQQSEIESMPTESQSHALNVIGQSLGLYPAWWDRWIPTVLPKTWLVKRRVFRRLDELELDDFAIVRDGGVSKMDEAVRLFRFPSPNAVLSWTCSGREHGLLLSP